MDVQDSDCIYKRGKTYHKLSSTSTLRRRVLEDFAGKAKFAESRLSSLSGTAAGDHRAHHNLVE